MASTDLQRRQKPIFWKKVSDRLHINWKNCIPCFNFSNLYFVGIPLKNEGLNSSQEYCCGFIHLIANPKAYILFTFKVV